MNQSRIQIAKADIVAYFEGSSARAFRLSDLATILTSQRDFWRLAQNTTAQDFARFLSEHAKLKRLDFPFPYRKETRYAWGDVSLLKVLMTLKPEIYFSHYTALKMHGLTEQAPKTIYLNHEQRPQPQSGQLAQGRIDAAFNRKPRISQNAIDFDDVRICLINGMHTAQLGVINQVVDYDNDRQIDVRITNIERTLIDISVRPIYSGGVHEVAKAFELAKGTASVNTLAAFLQKMRFVYPYHQAIGFYLERAGFREDLLDLLRKIPMEYDFYLSNQMKETRYVEKWRLYVPTSL